MKARILVVEDDQLQRSVIMAALKSGGFEIETASDGLNAIWKIREGHYDIVILGYKLPEIDGLAVARLTGDFMSKTIRPHLIALTAFPEGIHAREITGGKAFDKIIEKWADLPTLLAPFISCSRYELDGALQDTAEVDLFLTAWDEHETVPNRLIHGKSNSFVARILVVEDDELQRIVLKAALVAEGYVVEATADGLSAVREIRTGGYDLALIDYELPEIDGVAVANLIGDLMGEGVRPRLVALTVSPDVLASRLTHPKHVFDEVVGKQETLETLLIIVKRHLQPLLERTARYAAEHSNIST